MQLSKLKNKQFSIQRQFNIAWIILTILLLGFLLVYNAKQAIWQHQQQQIIEAQTKTYQFDDLLDDLLQPVFTIPLYLDETKRCQKILPLMHQVLFENPKLSGLIISDRYNKIICSTIDNSTISLPVLNPLPLSLHGPFHLNHSERPVFLLRQRFGDYSYGVLILQDTLVEALNLSKIPFKYVAIYNKTDKKTLLAIKQNSSSSTDNKDSLKIIKNLQNIDNLQLIFIGTPLSFSNKFIYNQLLTFIAVLLVSIGFYIYFRRFITHRFSLQYALNKAIKTRSFEPYYQPVWNDKTQKFEGAEVLIRWQTEYDELVSPDVFIEEAERSCLIVPITLQLVEKAFKQCKTFFQLYPSFHLAFNVCPIHFTDAGFLNDFYRLCDKYHILPGQITLELTERGLFNQNDSQLLERVHEVEKKGFLLAIDDFGTGYANISYLRHFPFHFLKIDKLYIHAIGTGAITETLNEIIINLADSLNLKIIAEGIETKEQYLYLQQKGVHLIQGWYFSQAINEKQFKQLFRG